MDNLEKFAIDLHNEFKPPWNLSTSIDYVWRFKLNCLSDGDIIAWFNNIHQETQDKPELDITIENLPEKFKRDDWR